MSLPAIPLLEDLLYRTCVIGAKAFRLSKFRDGELACELRLLFLPNTTHNAHC